MPHKENPGKKSCRGRKEGNNVIIEAVGISTAAMTDVGRSEDGRDADSKGQSKAGGEGEGS